MGAVSPGDVSGGAALPGSKCFATEDDTGKVSTITPTVLVDHSRQWLPGEWVGGTLTYGGVHFPIEANTAQRVVVAGDLTSVVGSTYQLTLPDVARVQQYLQSRAVTVEVTYTRLADPAAVRHVAPGERCAG